MTAASTTKRLDSDSGASTASLTASRSQGETIAMVLAALGIGAVGLYLMRDLVAPAFFALTLVITVRPLVSWATGRGVPRPVAAVLAVILVFGFILSFFVALGVAVAQLVDTLPGYSDEFRAIWQRVQAQLASMGIDQASLLDQATNAVDTSRIVTMAQALLGQLSSAGAMLGVMALTVVFLMFDTAKIETRTAALNLLKPELATALTGFASSVRSYWLVSTIFGLIVAVLDVVALWILGVPLAITWGVLSFITNYIPNVGFFIGVIPPALLALVDSGPWTALWVLLAYMVLNFVIQSLIQPKFTGDAVGLNTTATFLSLLLWSSIVGGLGTILAVPLTLFAKALLIDSDPRSRWVGIFLSAGDTPVRDPDELDPEVLDELDLDGDGTGAADPEHGIPAVEEERPATPAP
ncbi:AI-2E family transporter [Actinomyces bowdenii]|uniref:AI-2E family transporter n=1 Tax=Actinomyces bowdenii TaxID=131109 RepID=A0A3P1V8N7_9ACTO|nr:AI-2E family transporter [Actinomyces bowdenii]